MKQVFIPANAKSILGLLFAPGLFLLLLSMLQSVSAIDEASYPTQAPAGLQALDSPEFDSFYVKPGFNTGNYTRVVIEQPEVALQEYWQWKFKHDAKPRDIERIIADTAKILHTQLNEKLTADNGYQITEEKNEGSLLLKAAVINLHLTAPDLTTPGQQKNLVRSAGSATFYLNIYDAQNGELLLRAIDHEMADDRGRFYSANRATNQHDLRIMISRWSSALRRHLDESDTKT